VHVLLVHNTYTLLFFLIFAFGCVLEDKPFVRKRIQIDDVRIEWFYYSRMTHDSPDFVTITKNGEKKEIYKAMDVITDVVVAGDSVVIKLCKPEHGLIYSKNVPNVVFNFHIVLDSSATSIELSRVPNGVN
jgi:hypothetical protein